MEKVELYEVVKVTEEVENSFSQPGVTPPKKRRNKSHEDGVEKPKKPRSAYLLYYFDVHQIMQQDIPNLPQSEINKRISESWKRLSVAEKGYYLEKAKSEKDGIDTSSLSPSKELPGFRKILPRASYFVLAKGGSSNQQPEVDVESTEPPVAGGSSLNPLIQEAQAHYLRSEPLQPPLIVDDVVDETEVTSHSAAVQGIPPPPSVSPGVQISVETPVTHSAADLVAKQVQGHKIKSAPAGDYSGATVQQVQQLPEETPLTVAIIPNLYQNLLEPKSLAGVSSVGPVMMVSVGPTEEQSTAPSYKMSVKTYTRRGRGRCLNPSCSFVYVTRHKPPTCPECGRHLGGKWIPAAKKTPGKECTSTQTPEQDQAKPADGSQPTQEGNADNSTTKSSGNKKEPQVQRGSKKQRVVPLAKPPEGSSSKSQQQTEQERLKVIAVQNPAPQRRPVRPILPACPNSGRAVFQIITLPPVKGKPPTLSNNKSSSVPRESLSGLKPNTLKQLGQTVTGKQESPFAAHRSQPAVSPNDGRMNIVSVVPFKQHTTSSFDLGLSTARGRGRCKNPYCDYMYKNRHKPALCPKCGCELSQRSAKGAKSGSLLDPYQALSAAQRDLQRQSTLQLLRRSLQIPEGEAELQQTLALIQELNSLQIVLVQRGEAEQAEAEAVETETLVESGWPQFFESAATHCGLCSFPLFKGGQSSVAGQEDCWLLTETLIQTATLQLKVCLNIQCLALHSFTDLPPGLFNIGNRLLVSIDLFLKIRASIRLGHAPAQVARTLLDHVPNHPVHSLSPEEAAQIQELLLSGYWAFECLTVRDYNDMICGICGVAPKLELAQRHGDNVLELKSVEFTWPEFSVPDEVHVDDFWLTMESEALEQAAFPADIPITRVDASIIAPFIPPLMRSATVINTEKDKAPAHTAQPSEDPSVLVRLIHDGQLRLDKIDEHSEEELRTMLERCGANLDQGRAKSELLGSLLSLYSLVQSGLPTAAPPPPHLTAGTLSKVCPHKVVCGSKYLVRGETARDHLDLLVSSRYWPPVYVSDCPRQVALCADMQYPEAAAQMWGRNQGCFSDPLEEAESVSCPELQEQPYSADLSLSVSGDPQCHPITKSPSCWMLRAPAAAAAAAAAAPEHHSMALCSDLEAYASLLTEGEGEEQEGVEGDEEQRQDGGATGRRKGRDPVVFNNTAYYFLYNRLVDFFTSRDIVSQQIGQVVKACQPGEVVIRDALYRLGVAHINTDREEEAGEGEGQGAGAKQELEAAAEAAYEVVLPQ